MKQEMISERKKRGLPAHLNETNRFFSALLNETKKALLNETNRFFSALIPETTFILECESSGFEEVSGFFRPQNDPSR